MFERSQQKAQPNALLLSRFQRAKRVVTFTGELARALAREFAPPPGAAKTAPLSQLSPLDREVAIFRAELSEVLKLLESGERLLEELPDMRDSEAMKALIAFDPTLTKISKVGTTLEGKAKALREKLAAREAATAAEAPAKARGTNPLEWIERAEQSKLGQSRLGQSQMGQNMLGTLKKLTGGPNVVNQQAEPPGPPPLPVAVVKAKQAFDKAFKFSGEVLAYVSPRLSAVRVALNLTGLPGKKRPMDDIQKDAPQTIAKANVPPDFRAHVAPLIQCIYQDMSAVRLTHVAVVQWEEALKLRGDAEILRSAMNQAPEERLVNLLAEMHPGKIEAAVVPLSHLHVTFRGLGPLMALFPAPRPPARQGPPAVRQGRTLGGG